MLMVFCALNIHQSYGMIELHFGIFVCLAFLLCYRDWRPIVFGALVAALHHLSFNYFQELGYGLLCFTETGLGIVFAHAAYVVVETVVLSHLAIVLRAEGIQASELRGMVTAMTATQDKVDLSTREVTIYSAAGRALGGLMERLLIQTTDAVEQLTHTLRNTEEQARQAIELVESAVHVAGRGGQVVSEVVSTMAEINRSSSRIADIISVIDSIAFQTNLLALNAAVEAARAGDQGRGFAVVAAEVRSLAQRSATAAREIKELIGTSVSNVSAGSVLVNQAGTTMAEVVNSVRSVTGIVKNFHRAVQQQSDRITQVNRAVTEMQSVARQNAALVESMSRASDQLRAQGAQLTSAVDLFQREQDELAFSASRA